MGQQPNLPLGIEDLPRPTAHPPAPQRWSPGRPGELGGPASVPRGGSFGTPGPDAGYALRLVRRRDLPGGDRNVADVAAVVAAVVAARSAAIGRAPVPADVDAALILLGLDDATAAGLRGAGHDHSRLRALVASIPVDRLVLALDRLRR